MFNSTQTLRVVSVTNTNAAASPVGQLNTTTAVIVQAAGLCYRCTNVLLESL
jgi:hypothetical protein